MIKKFATLFISMCFLLVGIQAQPTSKSLSKYSAYTQCRIYEVCSKLPIKESDYDSLANFFDGQEKLIQSQIKKGFPIYRDPKFFNFSAKHFGLLKNLDKDKYQTVSIPVAKTTYAILFRTPLELTEKQVNQFLKLGKEPSPLEDSIKSKRETEMLREVLSQNQLSRFFQISSEVEGLRRAKQDWKDLQTIGIADGLDSTKCFNAFLDYYMAKLPHIYYLEAMEKTDSVIAVKNLDKSKRPKLFLTLLGNEKYKKYFFNKNPKSGENKVAMYWQTLKEQKLLNPTDSLETKKKLIDYENRFNFAKHILSLEKTVERRHEFQYIIETKPLILKLFEEINFKKSLEKEKRF
jgi:hypothetical protein